MATTMQRETHAWIQVDERTGVVIGVAPRKGIPTAFPLMLDFENVEAAITFHQRLGRAIWEAMHVAAKPVVGMDVNEQAPLERRCNVEADDRQRLRDGVPAGSPEWRNPHYHDKTDVVEVAIKNADPADDGGDTECPWANMPTLAESLTYVREHTKDSDMAARCERLLNAVDPAGGSAGNADLIAELPVDSPCWPPSRPPDAIYRTADSAEQPIWKDGDYFKDSDGCSVATVPIIHGTIICKDLGATVVSPTSAWRRHSDRKAKDETVVAVTCHSDGAVSVTTYDDEPKAETWRDRAPLL